MTVMDIIVRLAFCFGCISAFGLGGDKYHVDISNNGPVVMGATITFKAELFNSFTERPSRADYIFYWKESFLGRTAEVRTENGVSYWNVTFPTSAGLTAGSYSIEVSVFEWEILEWRLASKSETFTISPYLNGDLVAKQNGTVREEYVSTRGETDVFVNLKPPDLTFVKRNASEFITYWVVDCVYYGQTSNSSFRYNFPKKDKKYLVEGLVEVSFDPLPKPTEAPINVTSTSEKSTTQGSTTVTEDSSNDVNAFRSVSPRTFNADDEFPSSCFNSSIITIDPNKTYGYFSKKIIAKDPLTNISVSGTFWLKQGDILNLEVGCGGSKPFSYCINRMKGAYNATGNETCTPDSLTVTTECDFPIMWYFRKPSLYTFVIIISNDVSKRVQGVGINVYAVVKKSQLSVIVVPVVCSVVAVILIAFGLTWYIQSRRRFTVEVADFDFGQVNELEQKTFYERVREAVTNAFKGAPVDIDEDDRVWSPENVWPSRSDSRNRKYGSMQ